MANKNYTQFPVGSYDAAKVFLIADPVTGELEKITLNDILVASAPTLYTADGTLADNRTVNLNGKYLIFAEGGNSLLSIDPLAFEVLLRATDVVNASSGFGASANSSGNFSYAIMSSTYSGTNVSITTNSLTNVNTHVAGQHIFLDGAEPCIVGTLAQSYIRSFNPTVNGNQAVVNTTTTNSSAQTTIYADFNDGVKNATIDLLATTFGSTITHTADSHVFIVGEHLIKSAGYPSGLFQIQDTGGIVNIGDFEADVNGNSIKIQDVNQAIIYNSSGIHSFSNGDIIYSSPTVPATSGSTGTTGQIAWDSGFIYVATGSNTWKRVAISTW